MSCPEAVRKHDGRVVAYDVNKVASSIARAASGRAALLAVDAAKRLGLEIAQLAGLQLVQEGRSVPASADIRALVIKLLREINQGPIADHYAEHARAASSLLWRIRVIEPGTAFTSAAGSPWDRRRLMESLRASGIARDPAGDVAREVERRIVALAQERISAAVIHALASMVLGQRAIDVRPYAARRIAFSAVTQVPSFDEAGVCLPSQGPALEAFWLQAVHSQEVARAVHDNLLSLAPYPRQPADESSSSSALDPLAEKELFALAGTKTLHLRCDGAPRLDRVCRHLAALPPQDDCDLSLVLLLQPQSSAKTTRPHRRAPAVTINLAGLLVREALRDQLRAAVRTAQMAALAVQAHREREEYFKNSPMRGRLLPVAIAGLWNAAAWLQGESFETPQITRATRTVACSFVSVLRGALDCARSDTGMELRLWGSAPLEATRQLWRKDREFFLRDGITLDAAASYDGGPSVALVQRGDDVGERIEFIRAVASAFDDTPTSTVYAPLGAEPDVEAWRDLLTGLAQSGLPAVQLLPGGSSKTLRSFARLVHERLQAYPLFEQLPGEQPQPQPRY